MVGSPLLTWQSSPLSASYKLRAVGTQSYMFQSVFDLQEFCPPDSRLCHQWWLSGLFRWKFYEPTVWISGSTIIQKALLKACSCQALPSPAETWLTEVGSADAAAFVVFVCTTWNDLWQRKASEMEWNMACSDHEKQQLNVCKFRDDRTVCEEQWLFFVINLLCTPMGREAYPGITWSFLCSSSLAHIKHANPALTSPVRTPPLLAAHSSRFINEIFSFSR